MASRNPAERDAAREQRARSAPPARSRPRPRRSRASASCATALALVDRDGLKALSMRRLGAELGVDPMAVYYHVPNKDALLDAIVEAVMADIDLDVDDPADPAEERILCAARAYRDAMLAHANALPIVLSRGPRTPASMRPVELLIGILRDAGLPPSRAMAGMNAIAATVRGTIAMVADDSLQRRRPRPRSSRRWRTSSRPTSSPTCAKRPCARRTSSTRTSISACGRSRGGFSARWRRSRPAARGNLEIDGHGGPASGTGMELQNGAPAPLTWPPQPLTVFDAPVPCPALGAGVG